MALNRSKNWNISAQMAALPRARAWKMPVQMLPLAQQYNQAKQLGKNIEELIDIVDHWWATVVDLHPFTKKAVYGAKLDESEKDIFVDTLLLLRKPEEPYTKITVSTITDTEGGLASEEQVCYTNLPFYVVTRSWSDGGNPLLTMVCDVSVKTTSIAPLLLSVCFKLEDGKYAEVFLREFGGVILVHPQQGEVAELVMALAECDALPGLKYIKAKRLRYERLEDGQKLCQRLFCPCTQRVNTDMAQFVKCANSSDTEVSRKLYEELWHYSMPQNFSLWDTDQLVECFQFQSKLATLSNRGILMLQPECEWVQEHEDRIKIAEDSSLLLGWQRSPQESSIGQKSSIGQHKEQCVVGSILPSCVLDVSKLETETFMKRGAALAGAEWFATRPVSGKDAITELREYLEGPGSLKPKHNPTRLWNITANKVVKNVASGTQYCAVSYVWGQWYKYHMGLKTKDVDTERLRECLLQVKDVTGIELFWVDCLCISQEDEEDKDNELPKMAQYYGEAAFTVALLPDVNELQVTPTPIPWQVIDVKAHYSANKKLVEQYAECEWLKRIWTMQEAWLARKLVIKTGREMVRGDYLELLRTARTVIDQYSAVPICLEWMNIGPSLVMGACTGNLLFPGETPSLLTRAAGSLFHGDLGRGLQTRSTTLLRALRLSNGRNASVPADRLIGLLGMVEQGEMLAKAVRKKRKTEAEREKSLTQFSKPGEVRKSKGILPMPPEVVFRLAAEMGMLGPEIMLCRGRLEKRGLCWLPNLQDDPKSVELPYTTSMVLGGTLKVKLEGAIVQALKGELINLRTNPRGTVLTGENVWRYSCTFRAGSNGKLRAAKIESIEWVKKRKRDILLLRRSSKQGPFITVRGEPRKGDYYHRKQGFVLTLDDDVPLEDEEAQNFYEYIIA
ncbi:heterokaryon incompatibility protein-domain-containing protein [Xylariales sp. AK1849]|nr:heterokaryon incompatibility protein-domain-containing protein [Xylariales sp. AK1849]